ncbi:MAG TPA: hypothetical protein VH396_12975 [Chitinophagaceae bacterium]|jgi:hypothetical protein
MIQTEIKEVTNRHEWNQFIKLPWEIYKKDSLWVPPLLFDLKKQLNQKVNPFFYAADIKYWIAVSGGRCIGRIAAIVNYHHNRYYQTAVGFFGYFECINDIPVSQALLFTANEWLRKQGMTVVWGPVNLSLNNESGLLIEGFHRSPIIQMSYNPPYYVDLLESSGYKKEHDLFAFYICDEILKNEKIIQRLKRLSEIVIKKEKISFRHFNKRDFKNEAEKIRLLFNDYMSDNWGFVPMDKQEFDFIAQSLKPVLVKELAIFAQIDGKEIGFSLALPDINQVLKHMNGKLTPFGIFRFLFLKNKITDIRVILMGISKQFRRKGLEAVFYYQTIIEGAKRKFSGAELSWVSEDNPLMIHALENLNAKLYKRYRVYKKELTEPLLSTLNHKPYEEKIPAY